MDTPVGPKDSAEVIFFEDAKIFRLWLSKNVEREEGIWVRFFKKSSGKKTLTYKEALDEALCFGWIDSLLRRFDDESYIQKFTPRRKKSMWSQVNKGKVAELIKKKRMTKHGLFEIERAKKDGRW